MEDFETNIRCQELLRVRQLLSNFNTESTLDKELAASLGKRKDDN